MTAQNTSISLEDLRKRRQERIWREGAAALLQAVRELPQDLPNDPRELLLRSKRKG